MKTIFEYDNYRSFLKDYYAWSKAQNKKFSFRYFARIAGYKSPNFLQRVMEGKRDLTENGITQMTKALKFTKEESSFFRSLVNFNQAMTNEEKFLHSQDLVRHKSYRKIHPLRESQYHYFSKWYFVPIRGLVGLPGFQEDPAWIAERLHPPISPAEAGRVLEELLKMGLIRRNEQGRLEQTQANLATPDEVVSSSLAQTHKELLKRASESIDRVPREKRDISAMTVGMSMEMMMKVKEKIQNFRRELVELTGQDPNPDAIFQINMQIFPVIEIGEEGTK